ncbi:hypothetical protein P8605_25695 [Streptomyces sp. T-3]|nr:hypothetical protein [Streptomyces sp. T-3]
MRRRHRAIGLAALVMAVNATATGCLLEDKGPLPPRYSGPPVAVDTVAAELTAAMAAEGLTLEQDPRPDDCRESLTGWNESETVHAELKAGFARARSMEGWQRTPGAGSGWLSLRRGNWTASTTLPETPAARPLKTLVVIVLTCDDPGPKPSARSGTPIPAASP